MNEEQKRKAVHEAAEKIMRKLAEEGHVIQGGWRALRMIAIPPDAPQTQLDGMELAFYAGAQHLFSAIMTASDGDDEEHQMKLMNMIHLELDTWDSAIRGRMGVPK